jgi:Flp pilus assembly protein TadG
LFKKPGFSEERTTMLARTALPGQKRSAYTLVMFALVAPVLAGMLGLVIDAGLVMAVQRRAQNAADAAALAAATDLMRGASTSTALATAQTFLNDMGLASVTLSLNAGANNALNIPPTSGPYSSGTNNTNYAEVILSIPAQTLFIQVLGVNANQQITARAVAGFEPVGNGEGAIVLNPNVAPGITVSGGSRLIVDGTIVVNSQGKGVDQYGNSAGTLTTGPAIKTSATPSVVAQDVQVVGGVDTLGNFAVYNSSFAPPYDPSNFGQPVFANAPIAPDPLQSLATPTTTSAGSYQVKTTFSYTINGNPTTWTGVPPWTSWPNLNINTNATLNPGIYAGISMNAGNVTFNPGIYVIFGGKLSMGSQAVVTGNGVMFYITGSDYNPVTGLPDANDGSTLGTDNKATGQFTISGQSSPGSISLAGIDDPGGPFNQMLIYQRRWDTKDVTISASANVNLDSTGLGSVSYGKWAQLVISGGGKYNAQFLFGSLNISGGSTLTLNAAGKTYGKANLVFLVE